MNKYLRNKMSKVFILLLLTLNLSSIVKSHLLKDPIHYDTKQQTAKEFLSKDKHFQEGYLWFEQRLDHFDMQNRETFKTRYWIIDTYFNPENQGGPLFLYLCGEWTCSNLPDSDYIVQLAKKHGAMVVIHEHRYYGMSQPKENWSVANLKYLNTDQALADIAYFSSSLSLSFAKKYNIPSKRWLLFGGSYPGALVSWFRNKYPHIALGSWSSSGVINAIEDFHQFDETVSYALTKTSEECRKHIKNLIDYTNNLFTEGKGQEIKNHWKADEMRDDEFFWFYSDIIAETVQYGERTELCRRTMELGTDYNLINQMLYTWKVGSRMGRDDYWSESLKDENIDFNKNGRQWTYQYCSELGYLQTPAKTYPPLKNEILELPFWYEYCQRIYGEGIFPRTELWNERYGGANPVISKVIYMNGDEDPWKTCSILETKNPLIHAFPNICDDCAHCVDLKNTNDPEILKNRAKAEEIVSKWLQYEKEAEINGTPISERDVLVNTYFINVWSKYQQAMEFLE